MKSCVQVYTGNGKGKTTAALGLAFRASGRRFHSYIGQFTKSQHTGEQDAIADNPYITLEQFGSEGWLKKGEITPEQRAVAEAGFEKCKAALYSGRYQIVIMDEINMAIYFGLIPVDRLLDLLADRPDNVELILTGRKADPAVIAKADLVSEINEVKHYYEQGVPAREGIEF